MSDAWPPPAPLRALRLSRRTAWDLSENALAAQLAAARAEGRALLDLAESNPTRVGLVSAERLVGALGHPRGARYEPRALGHPDARAAVSRYYESRGLAVDAGQVVISASTSEAYGWLLTLCCDPGDAILVPAPSYPLFDHLARLSDIEVVRYPLVAEEGFRIDMDALRAAVTERTRAIFLVHPNNPTGSFVRRDEALALEELASEAGLALVVDEVFGDYTFGPLAADRLPSFVGARRSLTFVLSGLSKVVALPQLKLGWALVLGPVALVEPALARLEMVADTYLSVSTPVQLALPELLAAREEIQSAVRARLSDNLAALDATLAAAGPSSPVRRLPVDGGWYAILEVPRVLDEDGWVELLVREEGVVVHPGWFFDMEREGYLVVSLLPEPAVFTEGAGRLVSRLAELG